MIEVLYKKKVIRDFLSLFTENYWKQLIGYILEYGIITFKKHHNVASLSPEDIFQIIDKMKKDDNLEEKKMSNIVKSRSISKDKTNSLIKSQSKTQIGSKPISYTKTPQRSVTPQRDTKPINKLKSGIRLDSSTESFKPTKFKKPILTKPMESDNESKIKSARGKKDIKVIPAAKPKPKGIIEQANLNKLKEKRNQSQNKYKINTDDESTKKPKQLYQNVESRIKRDVQKDKKKYLKNNSVDMDNSKQNKPLQINVDENRVIKNSTFTNYNLPKPNTNINTASNVYNITTSSNSNDNITTPGFSYNNTGYQYDRFIGDRESKFEERINGLKQKISTFEENNNM
jgi:hypothetical protein